MIDAVHFDKPEADPMAGAIAGLAILAIGFDGPDPAIGLRSGHRAAQILSLVQGVPVEEALFSILLAAFCRIEALELLKACAAHGPAYLEQSAAAFRQMRSRAMKMKGKEE